MAPLNHWHEWLPVSEPVTLERVQADELLLRALPMPARVIVLCAGCGAVEYR